MSNEGGGMSWWTVRPMQVLGSAPSPFVVVGVGAPRRRCSWWWALASLHRRHPFSFMVVVVRSFTFRVGVFCRWPRVARGEVQGGSRRTSVGGRWWWCCISWVGVSSRGLWW